MSLSGGHLGFERSFDNIMSRFYWPNYTKDIKKFVQLCLTCASVKPPQRYSRGLLKPIRSFRPYEIITCDILGPLP